MWLDISFRYKAVPFRDVAPTALELYTKVFTLSHLHVLFLVGVDVWTSKTKGDLLDFVRTWIARNKKLTESAHFRIVFTRIYISQLEGDHVEFPVLYISTQSNIDTQMMKNNKIAEASPVLQVLVWSGHTRVIATSLATFEIYR